MERHSLPDYSNPQIRDGINVSDSHPLADFARLVGGILVVLAIVVAVLALAAGHLAKHIPFETEVAIANRFAGSLEQRGSKVVAGYLDGLTAKIAAAHDLPPGMNITVHYLPDDTVNAFAMLGGHVAVYDGLMQRMPNENALAMVISHEIAHVKLRHPISSMGRGIVVGLALTLVSTAAGGDVVRRALGPAGLLTMTSFSRDQERDADAAGLAALVKVYGHAGGAADTFRQLKASLAGQPRPPAFFSTHPLDDARIESIASTARERGWSMAGELTPYPVEVVEAIAVGKEKTPER